MAGFHTKTFTQHNDYMTPKHAWEDIQHLIPKDKVIYEPFYGDGKSGDYLTELGYTVIHEDVDFYDNEIEPEWYDIIVSNPPFSDAKRIMKKLAELDKPFIMLMPSSKINTSYFRENFKDKQIQIIIPRKRIHFHKLVNGQIENKKSSCNFDCFYYAYKMELKESITWLD